jgi:hypothetical protein
MNYRSLMTRRLAWATLMLFALTCSPSVEARPPRARVAVAVIEAVDAARRELRFIPVDSSPDSQPPPRVRWSRITCVLRDGQPVEASTLAKGMTVRFSYRTPFFGSPFATEIKIMSQPPAHHHDRNTK